ncbi:MAG: hypothetical protein ABII90_05950 [Bacteroidota bacterium]
MTVIEKIAKDLHLTPKKLIEKSLKTYIQQMLSKLDSEYFLIAKKHGVNDVFDMEEKVKKGLINENDAYDDFFLLDNIGTERKKLNSILNKL